MTASVRNTITNIDDRLGNGAERYFASGYRRVQYEWGRARFRDGGTLLDGRLAVRVPAVWSKKGSSTQRPHLSSIDAIAIGATVTEAMLLHLLRATPGQIGRAAIVECRVRAGRSPAEELDDLGFTAEVDTDGRAELDGAEPVAPPRAREFTTVCRVGGMTIRTTIGYDGSDHPILPQPDADLESLDELLGPDAARHYGAGFRRYRHDIGAVTTAGDRPECVAQVGWGAPASLQTLRGVDGSVPAAAQPITTFAVGLQLGQLLLYDLDDMDRASSNTLWMRRLDLTARGGGEITRPALIDNLVTTRLTKTRSVDSKDSRWRVATIETTTPFVEFSCDVSHQIPVRTTDKELTG